MKPCIAALLAAALLAGCGAVGDVLTKTGQILMDPSIPVGTPEDQPSQIGLSLYAADDVNPNPQSTADPQADEAARSAPPAEGPFEVNLKSGSRRELIEGLRGLLDELEVPKASEFLSRIDQRSSRVAQAAGAPGAASLPSGIDVSQYFMPNRQLGGKPSLATQGVTRAPLPLALAPEDQPDADASPDGLERGPGQYSHGQVAAFAAPASAARNIATPVAFKVLQLKDDSLLLNADPLLLAKDLKKTLGTTFVAQDDYVLVPGQFKYIDFARIQSDTKYVAIVADFHEQNGAVWKQAFRLEPRGRKYALLLTLRGNRVAITDESHRPSQPGSQP
ncbi:type VI secretion system lipoprotein TssJ [Achromobacter spanius]|uniref:type VI secretion system lipoprotein TssJ n=1 Tax=Achromobacter spanius TaxID=217203 RepID=UPI003208A814